MHLLRQHMFFLCPILYYYLGSTLYKIPLTNLLFCKKLLKNAITKILF
ncbi:unnamed protein product [Arabidopsis halleri]